MLYMPPTSFKLNLLKISILLRKFMLSYNLNTFYFLTSDNLNTSEISKSSIFLKFNNIEQVSQRIVYQ